MPGFIKYSFIGIIAGLSLAGMGFLAAHAETPAALTVGEGDFKDILRSALADEGYSRDAYIRFFTLKSEYTLADHASTADVRISRLDIDPRTDRFTVDFAFPGSGNDGSARLSGQIENVKNIPVLARQVAPGDVITKSHINWTQVPVKRIGQNIIQSSSALIGMTPRRPLRTDTPVRLTDIERPVLVKKGTLVTMLIESGALSLSAIGRALQNGADGDVIQVMNTTTHRTIEGTVMKSGQIRIQTRSSILASVQ